MNLSRQTLRVWTLGGLSHFIWIGVSKTERPKVQPLSTQVPTSNRHGLEHLHISHRTTITLLFLRNIRCLDQTGFSQRRSYSRYPSGFAPRIQPENLWPGIYCADGVYFRHKRSKALFALHRYRSRRDGHRDRCSIEFSILSFRNEIPQLTTHSSQLPRTRSGVDSCLRVRRLARHLE